MTREIQPLREAEITRQIARVHFEAFDRWSRTDIWPIVDGNAGS